MNVLLTDDGIFLYLLFLILYISITPPRQRYFCHPTEVFETLLYSSRVVDRIPLPWWKTIFILKNKTIFILF